MKELATKESPSHNLEVRYTKDKKTLTIVAKDLSWKTPFQQMFIADIITAVYDLMLPGKNVKFEFNQNKDTGEWGFLAKSKE